MKFRTRKLRANWPEHRQKNKATTSKKQLFLQRKNQEITLVFTETRSWPSSAFLDKWIGFMADCQREETPLEKFIKNNPDHPRVLSAVAKGTRREKLTDEFRRNHRPRPRGNNRSMKHWITVWNKREAAHLRRSQRHKSQFGPVESEVQRIQRIQNESATWRQQYPQRA